MSLSTINLKSIPKKNIPVKEIYDIIQKEDSIDNKTNEIKKVIREALGEDYQSIPDAEMIHDTLDALLAINAELEHTLMIQYLFAAYSIDLNTQGIEKNNLMNWQMQLLGVAREEMGHLMIVQNIRKSLGFELHFDMNQLVYYTNLFPYTLILEKLTLDSLAKYIYAESPEDWYKLTEKHDAIDKEILIRLAKSILREILPVNTQEQKQHENLSFSLNEIQNVSASRDLTLDGIVKNIVELIDHENQKSLTVSELFTIIIFFIEHFTAEKDFSIESVYQQAKADQWNRGYVNTERTLKINDTEMKIPSSDVLVNNLVSKWECLKAIKDVAEQGENPTDLNDDHTHFYRFKLIFKQILESQQYICKDIASNPVVPKDSIASFQSESISIPIKNITALFSISPNELNAYNEVQHNAISTIEETPITNEQTKYWAELANTHYTLLLTFVEHSFYIEPNHQNNSDSIRGLIINSSFTEMYNLKSISEILTTKYIHGDSGVYAGLPFQIKGLVNEKNTLDFIYQEIDLLMHSNNTILKIDNNAENKFLLKLKILNDNLLKVLTDYKK